MCADRSHYSVATRSLPARTEYTIHVIPTAYLGMTGVKQIACDSNANLHEIVESVVRAVKRHEGGGSVFGSVDRHAIKILEVRRGWRAKRLAASRATKVSRKTRHNW